MARTLLQLVQQACSELGIPEPASLIGSLDDQGKQLVALANREGKDFSALANANGGWTALHKDYTFTTVASQQEYDLPADFAYFVQRTWWDGSMKWELLGPITAQEKQVLRYGIIANGPRRKFYISNGKINIVPTPEETGETIAFDYFSSYWCESASGTAQARWNADTDVYLLDEDCFVQGIKWRFLRAKGLSYDQEKLDYDSDCGHAMSRDGGTRDLNIAYSDFSVARLLDDANIPDTGFGV